MRITRKITRKLTSIIALSVMVAALLAVVAVTQSSTANAQAASKTISNLQLNHNDDGDLLINWDAPESAPRDYRVMWAKSSENYKTWTDTTGNAFPTSASHTVSGLDRGHEYKVKVRARYSNGSGPWSAEVQHTIPEPTSTSTPTPEPSDAPHWVSSTMPDHVTMFDWSDVEGATGYDIQMASGSGPEWVDIAKPSPTHGFRAYMNGSSAIISTPGTGDYHVRVRATLEEGEATDWYVFTIRPE